MPRRITRFARIVEIDDFCAYEKQMETEIAVMLPFAAIMGLYARTGTAFRDLFPFILARVGPAANGACER